MSWSSGGSSCNRDPSHLYDYVWLQHCGQQLIDKHGSAWLVKNNIQNLKAEFLKLESTQKCPLEIIKLQLDNFQFNSDIPVRTYHA